ncbi:MAG TPA: EAL domain-containing protein, partial [Telluria sp.]
AHQLIFEVTEGLLIEEIGQTIARMRELAAIGIRFSIDDFGTGYSNLAYLKKMPLYELKIDKGFMRDTPHDANGTAIVQSILAMAGHLGLRVVAEGIETDEQARFLAAHGSSHMQGYLYHRPMPLDGLIARLNAGAGVATAA